MNRINHLVLRFSLQRWLDHFFLFLIVVKIHIKIDHFNHFLLEFSGIKEIHPQNSLHLPPTETLYPLIINSQSPLLNKKS
jgi:hypothetical protein